MRSPYFHRELGTPTMELIWNMKQPLWVTRKIEIINSSLCVSKKLVGMLDIGNIWQHIGEEVYNL